MKKRFVTFVLGFISATMCAPSNGQDLANELRGLTRFSPVPEACTIPPGAIPNYRVTAFTATSVSLAWDPPAGAGPGFQYNVWQHTNSVFCAWAQNPPTLFANTTATSITVPLTTPDVVYGIFVRAVSDPCVETEFTFLFTTFTSPPQKPSIPTISAGAGRVTLTFSYSDPRAAFIRVERASATSGFSRIGSVDPCTPDPKTFIDSGGGNLASGIYRYRIGVGNFNYNYFTTQPVYSDIVSVTVGPPVISFAATPLTIRAGQSATLSWVVQGATSVLIDQGVGAQPSSGSVTISPTSTTTYTLTAMSGALSATATATVNVLTAPIVVVSSFPTAMLQGEGVGGASTTYTLSNAGGAGTTLTLSQSGTFFSQSPASFTLNPGATQIITITASAQPSGAFEGASTPSGNGVAAGLQIPVKLLSTAPPAGAVSAKPTTNRVDVAAAAGASPSGTVSFTNTGAFTLTGILVSDVPWLTPQSGIVTIPAGATAAFTFSIDRSKRPDSDALAGSAAGNISLVYLGGSSGKVGALDTTPPPSVSLVSVVDTVKLSVSSTAPPPLSTGEIALFVPGVGHVTGSVGTFISDVSLLNPPGTKSINDVRFFYTPRIGATGDQKSTSLPPVGGVSVALADVVKNVFGNDSQVGSLQIRSADADKLLVNTNIFVSSNPLGTFGTTIPTFRSDRAVAAGDQLVLSGLRQDSGVHTNLFIQETAGVGVTVQTEFLGADGTTLATRSDTVGPFALLQINNVAPSGAVAAILTNSSSSNGRFLAYATPIDNLSSDNWSVVDWSRQFGYSGSDPTIIPVAGLVHGANNTFFRTDVSITATGTGQASATLRYISRTGDKIDRQVTLGSRQTQTISDVISTLFGVTTDTVGFIQITPVTGTFAITSRTYSTNATVPGTFGTGVPTLSTGQTLKAGSLRAIGSLEDASVATIVAQRGATFRTNFALLETTGNSVRVRVTLRFSYPAGTKVQAIGSASKDYTLSANQYLQVNGMANDILGSARATLGDLRGLEADFQVLDGNGAVAIFTSSVDNGTADQILRTE
jgi:hypothetical protein